MSDTKLEEVPASTGNLNSKPAGHAGVPATRPAHYLGFNRNMGSRLVVFVMSKV